MKTAIKGNKAETTDAVVLPLTVAAKIFESIGDGYFRSAVEIIVKELDLGLDYAFVGELVEGKKVRTVAFYALDQFIQNTEYDLKDTPCNSVVGKKPGVYGSDIQKQFPKAELLREMNAQSFIGVPLFSSDGSPLGLIAGFGRNPLPENKRERITALLQVLASGAVRELERKRREDVLQTSEANYRAIFDSANDGIFIHDLKTGDVVALNRKASEMYGYSLKEFRHFIDESFFTGVPGYTAQDAMKRIQSAAQGPPQVFEWLSKRKDGRLFWVEVNLKRAVIGGKTRLLAIVRDITERKKVEETLKLTQFSVDHASVSAFLIRSDARIQYANEQACRSLGYTREELLVMTVSDLDPDLPLSAWPERWARLKKAGSLHLERVHRRKDGTLIPVQVTINYVSFGGREYNWAFALDISERKKTEQKLQKSEERFRQLAENTNQVFWFMTPYPERILYVSPAFESVWGYAADELYRNARLWIEAIHPEDRDRVERDFVHWAEGRTESYDAEYRIVRPDREIRWIRDRGTIVRDVEGRVVRLSGIADDITDRKGIEQEIRKANSRLEEAQGMAHIGNWEWDVQTNTLSWSGELYRIFDIRPAEFKGTFEAFIEAVHPEDRATIQRSLSEAVNKRKETAFNEYRIIRPDGDIRVLHSRLRLEYDSAGSAITMRGTAQDVTESRRAQESLKLIQISMDHASVSAFIIARDARILYANDEACRETGYSREELLSMTIPDLDPNFPISRWGEHWAQLKKKGFLHFESLHRRKDGTLLPMNISVNYLSFGGREYNVGFSLDISERKQAENSLRQSYKLTETIINSMNDPVSLIDVRDFTIVRVNTVFLRKYGYSDESEIAGKHCYEITHHRPDVCSPPDDICPLIETVKTRDHFAVDHVHYDRRGQKIYVEVSTSPIKDEAGNVIQVVHLQRDITERKMAEEALRESEERFRAFFELAAVGAVEVDPATGRFLRMNDRYCQITGYSREELLSKTFHEITHPDDRLSDRAFFETVKKSESKEYTVEKRYLRKDGQTVWVNVSATIIRNKEGKPVRTAGIVQDMTDRKRMEEEIRHMAHHDTLTGLPNRRLFRDIINLEFAQAQRTKKKIAVLFLDLDRFKEINDTLGHEAGDLLLKQVASRLKTLLRKSDTISRIGGDEFNIILTDIARPESVSDIARKLNESFRKPFKVLGHDLHLTASIGISIFPDDSDQVAVLLRYSDMAMYHSKESGRNTYRFYDPSINIRSIERMRLENMLFRSLELDELIIYYQPQISISERRVVCAEALIRWHHPEKGLLLPKDFIPAAEETGFITAIDEFVLTTVCRQVRTWLDAGLPRLCVTVNLSSRQFQSPELINKVDSILKKTGVPAECLDIEISESMVMSNVERSAARMRELAGMGVHISIDDFGTGYSSLNYLKRLPIEKLKIDRSFIQDIVVDRDDRAIVTAVTLMAHTMNLKVVAEGVETEGQLDFLRALQCDEAQGFLFSRPLTVEEFTRQLVETK